MYEIYLHDIHLQEIKKLVPEIKDVRVHLYPLHTNPKLGLVERKDGKVSGSIYLDKEYDIVGSVIVKEGNIISELRYKDNKAENVLIFSISNNKQDNRLYPIKEMGK